MNKHLIWPVLNLIAVLVLATCAPIISSDKAITSFAFLAANNPGLSQDYLGSLSGAIVRVIMPSTAQRIGLVATFASTAAKVEVNGVAQTNSRNAYKLPARDCAW